MARQPERPEGAATPGAINWPDKTLVNVAYRCMFCDRSERDLLGDDRGVRCSSVIGEHFMSRSAGTAAA